VTLLTVRRAATGFALVAALSSPLQAFAQEITIGGPFEGEARSMTGAGSTFAAPTYNMPDTSSQLKFTGDTLSGILGAAGNPGVAGEVLQTPYAIGYVELIYALQNNLGFGVVQNSYGEWIQPSLASVTAAAASASSGVPADLRFSIVNAPGQDAYPISTATWLLTYREVGDRAKGLALTRMLWWATHDGQQFNNALAYATVPPELTTRSEEFIREIAVQGKPIFPGQ
jgi:ABC-type phosphate transport system substrate-binding protein